MAAGLVVQDTVTGPQASTLGQGASVIAPSGDVTMNSAGAFTIAAGAVTAAKLADAVADALWTLDISAAAESGNKRILTVTVKDLQGNTVAAATQLVFKPVTAVDASYAISDEGAGTALSISGDKVSAFLTHTDGTALIGVTDTAAETIGIAFETPRGPVVQSLVFA